MFKFLTIQALQTLKIAVAMLFMGFTFVALGSIGGGSKSKTSKLLKSEFFPIKTSKGFTLRAGLNYKGSLILKEERNNNFINYTSLITYQKGNTTYIVPNSYKLPLTEFNANSKLQLLNFKIKINK